MTRRAAALFAVVLVVAGMTAWPGAASAESPDTRGDVVGIAGVPLPIAPAGPLGIPSSVSVALVEGGTGQVLVAQDEGTRRPIASAIKLVTALVVVDALPPGTPVTVGDEVLGTEGASFGLRPGDVWDVEDLLAGLLLRSGNDVAVALAVEVAGSEERFVARMAARLASLGIAATPSSASGLEEGDALSAIELATVARASLAEPRIRDLVSRTSMVLRRGTELTNRNAFLDDDPSAIGLKTGFTNAAGFTLAAAAERVERSLVAVVLGADDDAERRRIAGVLMEHGFASTRPVRTGATLGLRTSGGSVALRADLGTITVGVGSEVRLGWPVTLRASDTAPRIPLLVDGQEVGTVVADRLDAREGGVGTGLGRALADGVYGALRADAIERASRTGRSAAGGLR